MTRECVRALLLAAADSEYKEFNDKIANCQTAPSLGVRVPDIRKIAKQIVADGWEAYLAEMEALGKISDAVMGSENTDNVALMNSGNNGEAEMTSSGNTVRLEISTGMQGSEDVGIQLPLLLEEHMLQGIVTGSAKMTDEQRVQHLDAWIPGVLSWGDCDCCVSSFKFMKKNQEFWFGYLSKWLDSGREFEVRVAIVALMQYFINDTYIDRVLEIFARDYGEQAPYYIRMAQAWALSVCFVKFRDKTWDVFARRNMEPWVQNKAIQKCRESYRVSKEDKELLLGLKM